MSIDIRKTPVEEDVKSAEEAFLAGRPVPTDVGERLDERTAEIRHRIFE
jgi:hypothetical protein